MALERPYWHVDAKWIFGLLFSNFLLVTLLVFVLMKLTSQEVAIPTATFVVASQFSRNGLDDASGVEEIKKEFLSSGQEVFYPFGENQPVFLTKEEVKTLSPRELRLKIFRQVVEPVYYKQATKEALSQYGVLALVNIETHKLLNKILVFSLLPLVISLVGLVKFSWRYGKLINPALPLIAFGGPPALLFYLLEHTTPPKGDSGPFSFLPKEMLREVIGPIAQIFNFYVLVGGILLLAAIVIKVIFDRKVK